LRKNDFFHFMANHEAFTLTKGVLHFIQTDFDLEKLAAVNQVKSKFGVLLRRTTGPE